jgi:ABC-type sugar transport system permease subunit
MNRWQWFRDSILLGMLAVGPAITFVSFLVRWPLGLTSSRAFTTYAPLMLEFGLIAGLTGGLACGATRCRPWRSAALAGGVTLGALGTQSYSIAVNGGYPPNWLGLVLAEILVRSVTTAVVGYLIAIVVNIRERESPEPRDVIRSARSVDRRFRI